MRIRLIKIKAVDNSWRKSQSVSQLWVNKTVKSHCPNIPSVNMFCLQQILNAEYQDVQSCSSKSQHLFSHGIKDQRLLSRLNMLHWCLTIMQRPRCQFISQHLPQWSGNSYSLPLLLLSIHPHKTQTAGTNVPFSESFLKPPRNICKIWGKSIRRSQWWL